jgi:hypothetical protein
MIFVLANPPIHTDASTRNAGFLARVIGTR